MLCGLGATPTRKTKELSERSTLSRVELRPGSEIPKDPQTPELAYR
jgi:hypothetical protein